MASGSQDIRVRISISNSFGFATKPLEYEYRYIWDNPVEQTGSQISASRRLGSGEGGVVYDVACLVPVFLW